MFSLVIIIIYRYILFLIQFNLFSFITVGIFDLICLKQYTFQIMARITRPKNNQVFQIHSILSAVLGLLIFIFPHSCGVFFLEGSTKNGIESETGHLLIRMYGILNMANAWILHITSKKATALTKNCLIYGYAFCYVFSFLEICHRSARRDAMNFGFFGFIFMVFYLTYAVVYCWICFTSEDEEEATETTSNPVFTNDLHWK